MRWLFIFVIMSILLLASAVAQETDNSGTGSSDDDSNDDSDDDSDEDDSSSDDNSNESDGMDDDSDDDDSDDVDFVVTSHMGVGLSEEKAIAMALDVLSDYSNLSIDEAEMEDDGWEIEFTSAMYEIEVFVSNSGDVKILQVKEEGDDSDDDDSMESDDDSDEMDEEMDDSDDDMSDAVSELPTVSITDAISQAQSLLTGEIIEIQLKSSDKKLYWDIRSHLKERLELDARSGDVNEFKSKVNGTQVDIRNKDNETEVEIETEDGKVKAKGNNGFWSRLFSIFG